MTILSSDPRIVPVRSRVGEYDGQLLCPACEASLSEYDGYAHRILFRTEPTSITRDSGENIAATFANVDKGRLKVFFVSLMWRMHATSRPMFKYVDLESIAPKFQIGTLTKDPEAVPELDVVVQKFDRKRTGVIGPTPLSFNGLAGYRVCFSGYSCWVKVDGGPICDPFDEVALSAGPSLNVLLTDYLTSPERKAARKIVLTQRSRK